MFQDRTFRSALIVSTLIHYLMIWYWPSHKFIPPPRSLEKFEVTYRLLKEHVKTIESKTGEIKKEVPRKAEVFESKRPLPQEPPPTRERLEMDVVSDIRKPERPGIDAIARDEAAIISYNQIIREKIKKFTIYPQQRNEGEVYVNFTVTSTGALKDVSIDGNRSSTIPALRVAAISGIKSASPFPPFPKDIDLPEVSFTVIISFELKSKENL